MGIFTTSDLELVEATAASRGSKKVETVINGQQNPVTITVRNKAQNDIHLVSVGGSFHDPARNWKLLRNTTSQYYKNTRIPAASNISFPYSFHSEFPPTNLGLTIFVDLTASDKTPFRSIALNQTVLVHEPPSYVFSDPGLLFLYALLAAMMSFAVWSSWHVLGPKIFGRAGGGKGKGKGAKKGKGGSEKKVKVVVPAKLTGNYPESVKPYDEEWIPAQLLKQRVPRSEVLKGASIVEDPSAPSGGDEGGAQRKSSALRT
ncbi:hypothetical protein BDY24DRAFT_402533 [Mrakia frigida]|uniref:uncharacterized protein n=1 Tax=Mrakia frigida TaxID=29902 RepID=UPI003FCBF7EC